MTQSYINDDSAWIKYQELAEWAMKSSLSDGDDDSGRFVTPIHSVDVELDLDSVSLACASAH